MLAIIDKFLEEDNLSDVTDIGTTLDPNMIIVIILLKILKILIFINQFQIKKLLQIFFLKY